MAISFPAGIGNFFGLLPIKSAIPDLPENFEAEETGNGEVLTADRGQRLWEMTVALRNGTYDEIEAAQALIRGFRRPGATFYANPIPRKYPRSDPNGSILGGQVAALHTVAANRREIRLSNLPAGYVLGGGDCLSFNYGSNPVRRAFHQIFLGTYVADAQGLTPLIELSSPIATGFAIGQAVALAVPSFKAVIVPGSTSSATATGQRMDGSSFTIRQTLG